MRKTSRAVYRIDLRNMTEKQSEAHVKKVVKRLRKRGVV